MRGLILMRGALLVFLEWYCQLLIGRGGRGGRGTKKPPTAREEVGG